MIRGPRNPGLPIPLPIRLDGCPIGLGWGLLLKERRCGGRLGWIQNLETSSIHRSLLVQIINGSAYQHG